MFKQMFTGKAINSVPRGDSMSVNGTNSGLYESLLSDSREDDEQELRVKLAEGMKASGFSETAVALMIKAQPSQ